MPRAKSKGLYYESRTNTWYVNKQVRGRRFHFSTGERSRAGAERHLARWLDARPEKKVESIELTFRDAAIRFILTSRRKNLPKDVGRLTRLFPLVADVELEQFDVVTLEPFYELLEREGRKDNTRNAYTALVRTILHKCEREWKRGDGRFWLRSAPYIPLVPVRDAREPYPLSREEADLLLSYLPVHLHDPVLFALHTGLRDAELVGLRWSDLRECPETGIRYFLLPGERTKNGKSRRVLLNAVAREVISRQRRLNTGNSVFTYRDRPMTTLRNTGWKNSVKKAAAIYEVTLGRPCPDGFRQLRVHDTRHSFATWLRSCGVNELDIASLLGHSNGGVTAHYAAARLRYLQEVVEKIA